MQAEITEGQVEDGGGRFGREPPPAVDRVEDPADLAAAVALTAQEDDHVTGELTTVAPPRTQRQGLVLGGQIRSRQGRARQPFEQRGAILGLERQVPADVRATPVGQHRVDVVDDERPEREPVGEDRIAGAQQHVGWGYVGHDR